MLAGVAVKQELAVKKEVVKQEEEETKEQSAVVLAPELVHVKRNTTSKTVTQGCTYWLGGRVKFNGIQLPQSPFANPFPDAVSSVQDGRYDCYLRSLPSLNWSCLNGQVLGCACQIKSRRKNTLSSSSGSSS